MSSENGQQPDAAILTPDITGNRISVRDLWKVFGPLPERVMTPEYEGRSKADIQAELGCVIALQDVSFDVERGEIFVVMGLSGSGKSTLIRCLIRLIEPTSGEIWIDGEDVLKYNDKELTQFRRRKSAMVFQHFGLLPHRSIIDNAAWGLEVQGMNKRDRYERARQSLEIVGLQGWENAFATELSGGMQQRVGLARALTVDPEILLMDEPFSALDPLIRREMQDELLNLQQRIQKTIIFITHDLDEALKLGTRIAIMRDGKIIQMGAPEDIVERPADAYVEDFIRDVSKTRLMGAASIMEDPAAKALATQPPESALVAMREAGVDIAAVVDSADGFMGVITAGQAAEAASRGVSRLQDLDYPESAASPRVPPETSIDDLVPLAAATEHPISVVDEDGRLLGVIPRTALLASLARNHQAAEASRESVVR
ncbi:MAG: glycine betaine/L-proline ABC transporter ATP-binding protein [Chloroflexota bacterium]|nr:glycine betaine/L-proline ABC transporter ATP-binding protein [Chloroflexota bacterium]MDE2942017.1 glycine betaine/L-proline ABC transporter ATP-binding protein [Chloroflexota bacterium]MDE3267115.1 glycine betaine/L-proline ABC transporter ATP-binding protein [Chloroflexota bacterium]